MTATAIYDMSDAPEFVLLDSTGPRPTALLFSFSLLSALLLLAAVLARPMSVTTPLRAETVSDIVLARAPLWLPTMPASLNSRRSGAVPFEPDPPAQESHPLPVPSPPPKSTARTDPPAAATLVAAGDARKPAPDALGTLPLPQLIEDEAALAAGLAALPPGRRLALPRLSIRVNADWLEALPQTKEELYFSVTRPQEDSEVLAYLPATRSFTLKRALRPLWQIRDGEQVPALAALRLAAARQLGVSPELVGLYTWHPPVLENALRMFILARMEHLGLQLGPSDVVTVRFASGPDGCLMSLEPIRATGSP